MKSGPYSVFQVAQNKIEKEAKKWKFVGVSARLGLPSDPQLSPAAITTHYERAYTKQTEENGRAYRQRGTV